MLKVTVTNVTRLSEDALYMHLADIKESDPIYALIEAELDRRAAIYNQNTAKKQADQLNSLKLTQAIQAEIAAFFEGFKGQKTLMLIENFGQEFMDDYTIDEDTFTVYSKVSHELFNNPTSWECDSIQQARRKMAKLIYNRVYDKFMRDPTPDNLELLKRVLGGSNEATVTIISTRTRIG